MAVTPSLGRSRRGRECESLEVRGPEKMDVCEQTGNGRAVGGTHARRGAVARTLAAKTQKHKRKVAHALTGAVVHNEGE